MENCEFAVEIPDWRSFAAGICKYSQAELPNQLKTQIDEFATKFQIEFGVFKKFDWMQKNALGMARAV